MESMRPSRKIVPLIGLVLGLLCTANPCLAQSHVIKESDAATSRLMGIPIRRWHDASEPTRAVAIAVHGLSMHGGTFDTMATKLARQGFVVYAPDLRGYGRWVVADPESGVCRGEEVSYKKSYKDLAELVNTVKDRYPKLPLFMVGESLGAGMVLHAASENPELISGIVLSSPAIKKRFAYITHTTVTDVMSYLANPNHQLDLIPYIKSFASEDPKIVEGAIADPLIRKRLSVPDLAKTFAAIKPNLQYAEQIPSTMPVLIIQGDNDRMLRTNAVAQLLSHMRSKDQTVKWFRGRGHLLLETAYVQPDTMYTVSGWLTSHLQPSESTQSAQNGFDLVDTTVSRAVMVKTDDLN